MSAVIGHHELPVSGPVGPVRPSLMGARMSAWYGDDFGNTAAAAAAVTLGSAGTASLTGAIDYYGDVDMFALKPAKDGRITVTLSPAPGRGISGDLAVFAGTTMLLRDANAATVGATVTFAVKAGTTYYLRAASLNVNTGRYALLFAATWTAAPAPTPPAPTPPAPTPPAPTPSGTYTPGAQVSWKVENGSGLVVLGTDGADAITVSKASGATVVYVNGVAAWTTSQVFSSVAIYGFGGDDTLVSISGAAETLYGGSGLDGFWVDSRDTVADSDSAESALKSVHVVSQFFSSASVAQPSMELAGQHLADPATSYAYANFSGRQVFTDGPEYNDIRQGGVGDCYYLAVLASLAKTDPGVIRQMVTALGDGTYAVRFFSGGQATYVRVDGDLPVYSGSSLAYANLSPDGELWVALVEKAYAEFRTGANSYASISGGWMTPVYTQITGVSASDTYSSGQTDSALASQISQALAAGHAVTAGCLSAGSTTIVGGHAYMVYSVQTLNGVQTVTVYNPWGVDGKGSDGNSSDGLVTLSVSDFRSVFSVVSTSAA
ncbi:MAG: C2 family cysteine protease [Planctomycetota bacterium]|nr:C2 family cysteine protease [Planctomycetota bacterium]